MGKDGARIPELVDAIHMIANTVSETENQIASMGCSINQNDIIKTFDCLAPFQGIVSVMIYQPLPLPFDKARFSSEIKVTLSGHT